MVPKLTFKEIEKIDFQSWKMLKELLWLQVITVAVTLPVHQQTTKLENETTSTGPEIVTTAEHEAESFLGMITDFNNDSTKEISLGSVSTQASKRKQTTTLITVPNEMTTKRIGTLNHHSEIKEKKKTKNPFPFYAYILFGLVPMFIIFILLR